MILRIDPRHVMVWTSPRTVRFGIDRAVLTLSVDAVRERLLAALQAGCTYRALCRIGRIEPVPDRKGIDEAAVERFVRELHPVLLAPGVAFAQDTGTVVKRSQKERELANEILCTCGCRLPAGTCGMANCEGKAKQLGRLKELVDEGKDKDVILATFVKEYGGQDTRQDDRSAISSTGSRVSRWGRSGWAPRRGGVGARDGPHSRRLM